MDADPAASIAVLHQHKLDLDCVAILTDEKLRSSLLNLDYLGSLECEAQAIQISNVFAR